MDRKTSLLVGNLDTSEEVKRTPFSSNDVRAQRRINIRMTQNVLLFWLNDGVDGNNEACQSIINQVQYVTKTVKKFTDVNQCIDFLTDIDNEKVFIIISDSLCRTIVPLIHNIDQLHTIFIFCENQTEHEQWTKDWFKIKGVFAQITTICEAVKEATQQYEQNAIPMSFVNTSEDISEKDLDQLDPLFMYTQILKEILLRIEFNEENINEFVTYSRDVFVKNEDDLVDTKKLSRKYHDKTPIWWYTCECFLYSTLNRALRLMDVDIIIKMGCFVRDLHRHIEQLHKEQFGGPHSDKSFMVYRGQGMSTTRFDQMMKRNGGLMSFSNFLSTSKDRGVSLAFAESNQSNPDFVGILFVMTIDSSKSTTPFASIGGVSCFGEEDEVLFSMHTIFRICGIRPMSGNPRLFQVDLGLTSDNDNDLRGLTDYMREEMVPNSSGWYQLGELLSEIGRPDRAQHLYEVMINQTTNESQKGVLYYSIGSAKCRLGEYEEAIKYYNKAISIVQKILPSNHPDLSLPYGSIGDVYLNIGEYSKALSYYEKALEIDQKSFSQTPLKSSLLYNSIGAVYRNMGEYLKALSYYEKALEIDKQVRPLNHPGLAGLYNNIGVVYRNLSEYNKALWYHEKALEIHKRVLPPNHPDLAMAYDQLGCVCFSMSEYSKALSFHEKELEIEQNNLPANHPNLARSHNNIGNIYLMMDNYSKALWYYQKSLEIRQQSLPLNYHKLAMSYYNIGNVYAQMGQYSEAFSFYERAVVIGQRVLPPNHHNLQMCIEQFKKIKKKL